MAGPRHAAPRQPSIWPEDRGGHLWAKDREVRTPDGTRIRYTARGPVDAPTVICLPGFLCPDTFWRDIAPDLADDHRVILFNHRGTGASSEAHGDLHPPDATAYTIPRLAADAAAVLDAQDARHVTVLGHSMGVQTALQLWRARPELVGGMVLVAGGHTSPFGTMYGRALADRLFPLVSIGGSVVPRALGHRMLGAIELPVARPVARLLHAIGDGTPWLGMTAYRAHLARLDHRAALWTARGMRDFDARPWLGEIDVPTVVMAGTADGWCPLEVARELAGTIPDARLDVLEGASHTLPLEEPRLVLARLRELTGTQGDPSPAAVDPADRGRGRR